jgi:hypothetical protein
MVQFTLQGISSLYDAMIEGYEHDIEHNEKLMSIVYEDFKLTNIELEQLLSCNLPLDKHDVIELWRAIYKWNLSIKDELKSQIVKEIYKTTNYKLKDVENTDMKYLIKNTCINVEVKCVTYINAAERGHIICLEYLNEKSGNGTLEHVCSVASYNGNLECLKYLLGKNCRSISTCYYAAINGKLECLQYAVENGCLINMYGCLKDAHKDCKEYLLELNNDIYHGDRKWKTYGSYSKLIVDKE